MSAHEAGAHPEVSNGVFVTVWIVLLLLSGVEVFLGYERLAIDVMIVSLMFLSVMKASLIIAYFMHLRYERRALVLTLIPMWVAVTMLLLVFFPDSFRLQYLRFPR